MRLIYIKVYDIRLDEKQRLLNNKDQYSKKPLTTDQLQRTEV